MPSLAPAQMTLSFEPSLVDRFPTLRHYLSHRSTVTAKAQKVQAADMDLSPSTLTRKLNPADGDTQRFNLDDLEQWLKSTGEAPAVIEYLAAKYMDTPEARKARALSRAESLLAEIASVLPTLREVA